VPTLDRDAIAATAIATLIAPYLRVTPIVELDAADFGLPPLRWPSSSSSSNTPAPPRRAAR
jgi:hypothetical protein